MGRLLCIDYGKKRCGIAVTDALRIVANPLTTVETPKLMAFLKEYMDKENVDSIIIGLPTDMKGEPSESMRYITPFIGRLRHEIPSADIIMWDERFTSTLAHKAMLDGGMKKSDRRDKATVDRMAAAIILNDYLQSRAFKLS